VLNFTHKVVWITGASSGIGRALAAQLALEKARLIISGTNEVKLNEVKEHCLSYCDECHIIPFDITNGNKIQDAVEQALKLTGGIDVLINNAGISQRSEASETPIETDRKIFETNFWGAVGLTKLLLPQFIERKIGLIIVVSSVVGKFGFPLRTAYSSSKHALQGYFESLRAELKDTGVKVLIVSPGRVKTNISINALKADGTAHNEMDPGQDSGLSAEVCARKMIEAARKGKNEIVIGRQEKLMVWIRRYLPSLYYKIVSKVAAK
jgi:short-subunit dehydrogenase